MIFQKVQPLSITAPIKGLAGRHCLLDLYGCETKALDSLPLLESILRQAASIAGATVLGGVTHKFNPLGVSIVLLLAESHISIHTWPEVGDAMMDVYTCGSTCDPLLACEFAVKLLQPRNYTLSQLGRGNGLKPFLADNHQPLAKQLGSPRQT